MLLESFVKTYADQIYRYVTLVRHQGTVIGFAMDRDRQIYYTILDLDNNQVPNPELDVNHWLINPRRLPFPNEIAEVGFGVADQTLLPTFVGDDLTPVAPGTVVPESDRNLFRSTTARFTADAPFQVMSDGRFVYLFRQAVTADDPNNWAKRDRNQEILRDRDNQPIPLVNSTLLVDRFVLSKSSVSANQGTSANSLGNQSESQSGNQSNNSLGNDQESGTQLLLKQEIRFRRSRSKTRPQSNKDSLGAVDMEDQPFYEPTQELSLIGNLQDGRFSALLLPTTVTEVQRWQIFAYNRRSNAIDSYNIERSPDGLFNTQGTQSSSKEDSAESALVFNVSTDHVALPTGASILGLGTTWTQELWIYPDVTPQSSSGDLVQALVSSSHSLNAAAPSIWIVNQRKLRVGFGTGQAFQSVETDDLLISNAWNHVAVSFGEGRYQIYLNGELRQETELSGQPGNTPIQFLGAPQDSFIGRLDEVRFWNRVRSQLELEADLHQRLTGQEPGLVAYWRLDEGVGDRIFDQTDTVPAATLNGVEWGESDAPIGENSGVNRSSFRLIERLAANRSVNAVDRAVTSGLTALLYFQQENAPTGYDQTEKPLKRSARVMLAMATRASNATISEIVTLDFGVSASGKLVQTPDVLPLSRILPQRNAQTNDPITDQIDDQINDQTIDVAAELQNLSDLQETVRRREETYVNLSRQVNYYSQVLQVIHAVVDLRQTITTAPPEPPGVNLQRELQGALDNINAGGIAGIIARRFLEGPFRRDVSNRQQGLIPGRDGAYTQFLEAQRRLQTIQTMLNQGITTRPMPLLHLDPEGLTLSGGILPFARTTETPTLYDSAIGRLALYFRGDDDQFLVTYYETLTERAQYRLTDDLREVEQPALTCVARSTEAGLDRVEITISGDETADTCTLTIQIQTPEMTIAETWQQIPRHPERFAAVINGLASDRHYIGSGNLQVTAGRAERLIVPEGVQQSLPANGLLFVGDIQVTLRQSALSGARELEIDSRVPNPTSEQLPIFFQLYDYATNAQTTQLNADLTNGSSLVAAIANPQAGAIVNQTLRGSITQSSRWVADAPGHTLSFNGNTYTEPLPSTDLDKLEANGDLTLEIWVKPSVVRGRQRLMHYQKGNSRYTLGLQEIPSRLEALDLNQGRLTPVTIPLIPALQQTNSITLEAWIRPDAISRDLAPENPQIQMIFVQGTGFSSPRRGGIFCLTSDRTQVSYQVGPVTRLSTIPIPDPAALAGRWTHVAAVYDAFTWRIYQNGVLIGAVTGLAFETTPNDPWRIGAQGDGNHPLVGGVAEIRLWNRGRSPEDIAADYQRLLQGNEAGLVGYWRFDDENPQAAIQTVRDYSRNANSGLATNAPRRSSSPLSFYQVFAGVGNQLLRSPETEAMVADSWTHLAMVFNQSYGVRLDGTPNSYLDCGNDGTLNISRDLTLEVFLKLDNLDQPRSLLSKGQLVRPDRRMQGLRDPDQQVPYAIAITQDARILFAFEDIHGSRHEFRSEPIPNPTAFHKITLTRKREIRTDQRLNAQGNPIGANIVAWDNIRFFVDDRPYGSVRYESTDTRNETPDSNSGSGSSPGASIPFSTGTTQQPDDIGSNNRPLEIGSPIAYPYGFFQGTISEVRIWNVALEEASLVTEIRGNEQGLVSWWRFEENEGAIAYDSKSNNHARFRGQITWVKDPNPNASQLQIYRDGLPLPTEPLSPAEIASYQSNFTLPQFTLGGWLTNNRYGEFFQGVMEEVRIWNLARTPEQLQDNLFRRLIDAKENLLAYYPFEVREGSIVADHSLQGNDLVANAGAQFILSDAPIAEDAPQVRSALAGIRTPFHDRIGSQPAIQEYGDLQTDINGNLIGVLKRCYSFVRDGQWQMITGFKVGDLVSEWVGQVQFDPQLLGYIEGAPPVPSENLTTSETDYNGATSVELVEAQQTTFTYAASRDQGFDSNYSFNLGFVLGKAENKTMFIPGLITSFLDSENVVGARGSFDLSLGWLQDATTGSGRSTTKTSRLGLRGRVENPNEVTYPDLGRRFVPENVGFALVQSQTADVFALRLRHTNALVSFQMRPNPDIPPDTNIITFPINPNYTKQGTLDGKIGFHADPDYPNALTFNSDSSYYKPIEAYALRSRIQREEEQIRAFYEQYDAGSRGRRQNVANLQAGDLGTGSLVEQLPRLERRNLVNNYVWTADGGLFAETQETLDVVQESTGGSYAFAGRAGFYANFLFAAGVGVLDGVRFGFEAQFGGHLNLQVTKSQASETAFGMNVAVDGVEQDVYQRDSEGNILFNRTDPRRPRPLRHPGKVDAYRFLSFYLEPNPDHYDLFFDRIVDPIWLNQSTDPNAIALRSVQNLSTTPPCWRMMHRVTFVSRVLPSFQDNTLPPMEQALQDLNIASNYELIKRIEPFVIDRLGNYAAFAQAVRDTIQTYLPELQPHTEQVIQFLQLYYGLTEDLQPLSANALLSLPETVGDRPPNRPPVVRTGQLQTLRLQEELVQTTVQGAVADDRLQADALFLTWSQVEGPAPVAFADSHALSTAVTFRQIGRYRLRLTASDGLLSGSQEVAIVVNQSPQVRIQRDALPESIRRSDRLTLVADLVRDGRGDPNQTLTVQWTQVRGPAGLRFANPQSLRTDVTFSRSGTYLLRLTATLTTRNGTLTHSDDVLIPVAARVTHGLQMLYAFEEGSGTTIQDGATLTDPLPLTLANPTASEGTEIAWVPNGLRVQPNARLTTALASRVIDAIKASNEFTLEAWIQPQVANQAGLGRILSLSADPANRNLVFGQSGDRYYLGLRTSTTNANGTDKALAAGQVTLADTPIHLVCTRDRTGWLRLYLNQQEVASRLVDGDLTPWDNRFNLVLGSELGSGSVNLGTGWTGIYHLIALYSRALTPAEIQQNYEYGADTNLAPLVAAGIDQTINLPAIAQLVGTLSDDRRATNQLQVEWTQVEGPAPVVWGDRTALTTTAQFSRNGGYLLRLTASDSELASSNEIRILVNQAPELSVPTQITVNGLGAVPLSAVLLNHGLADGLVNGQPAAIATRWERVSGPGTVTFSNANLLTPTVSFSQLGVYTLRLTVNNGQLTTQANLTATVNDVPVISINPVPLINLPATTNLVGQITRTGLANSQTPATVTWNQVSGPGTVTFQNPAALQTTASFSRSGAYSLRLTVNNGVLSTSTDVAIAVNQPPSVDAGPDRLITLPANAELEGIVSDDGLPTNPGRLTLQWTRVSGPGQVTFANPNSSYTTAQFSTNGTYILRLTANDGAVSVSDQVTITVNRAPTVNAGPDRLIALPVTLENGTVRNGTPVTVPLTAQVSDDGLPIPATLTTSWSQVSGPTSVAIANGTTPSPTPSPATATFSEQGRYVLQLTANDGIASASDQVEIVITPRVITGLQVLYTFQESAGILIQDVSGVGTPLNLTVQNPAAIRWIATGGLTVTANTLISSATAATKLIQACRETQEITLEAWIKPATANQGNPSRIISLSENRNNRNVSLQQGVWDPERRVVQNVYGARLRTTETDANGEPASVIAGVTPTPELVHLVYTRSRSNGSRETGITKLYLDGVEQATGILQGDFSTWNDNYRLGLANELTGDRGQGNDRSWNGDYYLVAIYSHALTATEVRQNFIVGDSNINR